jgi:hypothetical protein
MFNRYPVVFTAFNFFFLLLIFILSINIEILIIDKLTWSIYCLFVVTTLLMHFFLTNDKNQKPNAFVRKFMLATSLKLLLYLVIIVFFFVLNKVMAKTFIIWFLIHYTCFTVFETLMLYNTQKK